MSLHEAVKVNTDPAVQLLADYFNWRWGDAHRRYEATGDTITEWSTRNAIVIDPSEYSWHTQTDEYRDFLSVRPR